MYNIGIDFSIFNRLIAVEFDIYQRDRSGLLADRYGSLPNTFGSKLPQENLNGDRTRVLIYIELIPTKSVISTTVYPVTLTWRVPNAVI